MMRFLLCLALLFACAPAVRADPMKGAFTYDLGLRQAASDSLRPAVEFNLRYEMAKASTDPRWHHFNYAITAQGYQTFDQAIRDIDHMELGLSVFGRYYGTGLTPLAPEVQDHYVDLLEHSEAGGGPGITDAEEAELAELVSRVRQHRQYVGYSVYGRLVTDQRVESKLLNGGLSVQAEVPFLSNLLDAPFRVTRGHDSAFIPQPLRVGLAAEYVQGLGDRTDSYPRASGELLWSSRIFDRLYPRVRWQAEYSAAAPAGMHDFNHFLDAGVALPVTGTTSVVFKYLLGRTAPNYEKVNAAVLGFDVAGW